jgi:hypothetical protein
MRRLLVTSAVVVLTAATASADAPKCPDTSKVRSGTEFCAPENSETNFPSAPIAYCPSARERREKVCPKESIEAYWELEKQGSIDGYRAEVDAILLVLESRRAPSPERDEAVNGNPSARARSRDDEATLHQVLCIRGHQILANLEPRYASWRRMSAGKWALDSLKEADATVKFARDLEKYCAGPAKKPNAGR